MIEKVKYVSLSKINNTLMESLASSRSKPKDKIKTACFEAVSSRITLNESLNNVLDSTINSVLSTFKDREGNNQKVDALVSVFNKVNALGEFDKTPSLQKALTAIKNTNTNDKLRSLLSLWLEYLGASEENQNPLLKFNKEISFLSSVLMRLKNSKYIQGDNNVIDSIVSENGILEVLKKLSKSLFDQVHGFKSKLAQPANDRVFGHIEDFNKNIEPETNKILNKLDRNKEVAMECVHATLMTILHM